MISVFLIMLISYSTMISVFLIMLILYNDLCFSYHVNNIQLFLFCCRELPPPFLLVEYGGVPPLDLLLQLHDVLLQGLDYILQPALHTQPKIASKTKQQIIDRI